MACSLATQLDSFFPCSGQITVVLATSLWSWEAGGTNAMHGLGYVTHVLCPGGESGGLFFCWVA